VVTRGRNERAFHIFYQLLAGATQDEKARFNLRRPEDYHYLRVSDCYRVESLNDVEEFKHTRVAMDMCGISPEQQQQIFHIVSGIMHLGNVRFRQGSGEGGELESPAEVAAAAAQFGVDADLLGTALLHPKIEAGGKLVALHLTREQAEHAREATSKDIYNRLFLWVVARMNKLLSHPNSAQFIGVLDIAGFEIFEYNSFEQLCINYTNERLQAFFNNHMFTLEQEEYEREKIQWTWIDFGIDSAQVIDLISKKDTGILSILNEQCVFPKATDLTFLEKLHTQHGRSPKYVKPQFAGEPTFKLAHYAGQVSYNVTDWLEKNKDPLAADIKGCLRTSKLNLLSDIYNDNFLRDVERAQSPSANPNKTPLVLREGPNRGNQGAQFMTIAKKYDSQLGELMATLHSTYPHFVRCIIPNYQKRPGYLCADVVLEQLRCNGVLEGIRISRKGFPNRLTYKEFIKRYHLLGTRIPAHSPDPRADAETLVGQLIQQEVIHPKWSKDFKTVEDLYRFGLSKIFFRSGQLSSIEGERERRVGRLVMVVQAATRGWLARNLYRKVRTRDLAAKVIRRNLKAYVALSNWPWWKLFIKARPAVKEYDREAEIRLRENKIKELAGAVRQAEKERDDLRLRLEDSSNELAELSKKVDRNNQLLLEAEASAKGVCRCDAEAASL
jgi:myosin protein heavy chain